jgi:hypothetical protein
MRLAGWVWQKSMFMVVLRAVVGLPEVDVSQVTAALLDQAISGIKKETLLDENLVRIDSELLKGRNASE